MFGKSKSGKQSQTMKQFEIFLKKRNENNFILRSDNQSINTKVKCFEELIKLTRTGNTLDLPVSSAEDPHRCKSSKNIPPISEPFSEVDENSEFIVGKLSKMAIEMRSWETSKQPSKHVQIEKGVAKRSKERAEELSENKTGKKLKNFHSNSTNISRVYKKQPISVQNDECKWFTEPQNKVGSYPIKKKNRAYLFKYLTNKNCHNYHASSPALDIEIKRQNFSNLKKEIALLESKAKQCYGISFDCPKQQNDDEFGDFTLPEKHEFERVVATADARRTEGNNYRRMMKQHMQEDSSIPTTFLGIIRSGQSKKRPLTQKGCSRRYIRI